MDRLKCFEKELSYINNAKIKEFTEEAIKMLPDYFFKIPASSTGKYHPEYTTGDGGLVRHTQAAVRIAVELFNINLFTTIEMDCIVSALILHDGLKSGAEKSEYTKHEHPLLMGLFVRSSEKLISIIDNDTLELIVSGIESHMGQWNVSKYSNIVLKIPETREQRYIHMCDYLASRKCLEFKNEF